MDSLVEQCGELGVGSCDCVHLFRVDGDGPPFQPCAELRGGGRGRRCGAHHLRDAERQCPCRRSGRRPFLDGLRHRHARLLCSAPRPAQRGHGTCLSGAHRLGRRGHCSGSNSTRIQPHLGPLPSQRLPRTRRLHQHPRCTLGDRAARLLPSRAPAASAMDAHRVGRGPDGAPAGSVNIAVGVEHDRHPLHGVHFQGCTIVGHQHHAAGVQCIVPAQRLDRHRRRPLGPSHVRRHVVARAHPHLFGGRLRIRTPSEEDRNEHQSRHARRCYPFTSCPRPRVVPALAPHRLHVHHELQHDGVHQDPLTQGTQGFDPCLGVHRHHHPAVGPSRQPQAPAQWSV